MRNFIILLSLLSTAAMGKPGKPCCQKAGKNNVNKITITNHNGSHNNVRKSSTRTKYIDRVVPVRSTHTTHAVPVHSTSEYRERVHVVEKPTLRILRLKQVRTKYRTKIKYRTRVKRVVRMEYAPRNTLTLMLGASETRIRSRDVNRTTRKLTTYHEGDAGLMYQRRLGDSFSLGLAGTVQENVYLLLGVAW